METLAYLYGSIEYEDPNPAPELRSPQELAKLSNSVVMGLVGGAVIASTVADIPAAMAVVRRGDTCAAVGDVQRSLRTKGFYTGSVDNIFGSGTQSAVSRFQQSNGLTADGIVGPRTADALGLGDVENPNSPYLIGKSCTSTTPDPGGPSTGQEASGVVRTSSGSGIATRSTPNGARTGSGFADGATVFFNPTTLTSSGGFNWVKVTRGNNTGLWVARNFVGGGTTPDPDPGTGQESSGVVRTSSGSGIATRSAPNGARTGNGFADGSTVFFDITSRTTGGGFTWVRVTRGGNSGLWVAESFLNGTGNPNPGNPGTGQESSGIVRTSTGEGISTRVSPNGSRTGSGFADGSRVFYDITSRTPTEGYTWVRVTQGSNRGLWVAENFLNGTGTPNPGPGTGQEVSGLVRTSGGTGIRTRSAPNGAGAGVGFAEGERAYYTPVGQTTSGGYTWVRITQGSNAGLWAARDFIR